MKTNIIGQFFKSSFSGKGGKCVEVKIDSGAIFVRHSRKDQGMLEFTHDEWEAFLLGVKAGEFDTSAK
ncbi:MAG: DUF397 domain-containing protein [Sulfuritalea sp.]|nr:DUF397 domain-containing protein [Sulfuritalea sp.]